MDLGPLPTALEYEQAFEFWRYPDRNLGADIEPIKGHERLEPGKPGWFEARDLGLNVMGRNVFEHIIERGFQHPKLGQCSVPLPSNEAKSIPRADAQKNGWAGPESNQNPTGWLTEKVLLPEYLELLEDAKLERRAKRMAERGQKPDANGPQGSGGGVEEADGGNDDESVSGSEIPLVHRKSSQDPETAADEDEARRQAFHQEASNENAMKVDNHTKNDKAWRKASLEAAARVRGLETTGTNDDKKARLWAWAWQENQSLAGKRARGEKTGKSKHSTPSRGAKQTHSAAPASEHEDSDDDELESRYKLVDLPQWGLHRKGQSLMSLRRGGILDPIAMYTWALELSPYNPSYWLSRAYLYYQIGSYDLCLGDAYRAWFLLEILHSNLKRYKIPGLHPRIIDAMEQHVIFLCKDIDMKDPFKAPPSTEPEDGTVKGEIHLPGPTRAKHPMEYLRGDNGVNFFTHALRRTVHHVIALALLRCECWDDWEAMDQSLTKQLIMDIFAKKGFEGRKDILNMSGFLDDAKNKRENHLGLMDFERRLGQVDLTYDPLSTERQFERGNAEFLKTINEDYIGGWIARHRAVTPNPSSADEGDQDSAQASRPRELIEVQLKKGIGPARGLGVFAREDIKANVLIYSDEPSARGHLLDRPSVRQKKGVVYCENCKRAARAQKSILPTHAAEVRVLRAVYKDYKINSYVDEDFGEDDPETIQLLTNRACDCILQERLLYFCNGNPDTGDLFWPAKEREQDEDGSMPPTRAPDQQESCLQIAKKLYHYKACGKDWRWLHDAMSHKDPTTMLQVLQDNRPHAAVLALLMREVFDMTLLAQSKEDGDFVHFAHEIPEMFPLSGGKEVEEESVKFPFGWSANIVIPFDILMQLGVNVWKDLSFDTWVIQTVFRKLLLNVVPWDQEWRGNGSACIPHEVCG